MKNNFYTSHIKKGLVIALVLFVIKAIAVANHQFFNSSTNYATWIISVVGVCVSVIIYGKHINQKQSFQQYVIHGLKCSAVMACLLFVGMLLILYVIFPSFREEAVLNYAMQNGATQVSKSSYKDADFLMAKKVVGLILTAGTLMGTLILGLIGSIIGSITVTSLNK